MNIFVNVPFQEKGIAKRLGCKWDNNLNSWYIEDDNINKNAALSIWKLNEKLSYDQEVKNQRAPNRKAE